MTWPTHLHILSSAYNRRYMAEKWWRFSAPKSRLIFFFTHFLRDKRQKKWVKNSWNICRPAMNYFCWTHRLTPRVLETGGLTAAPAARSGHELVTSFHVTLWNGVGASFFQKSFVSRRFWQFKSSKEFGKSPDLELATPLPFLSCPVVQYTFQCSHHVKSKKKEQHLKGFYHVSVPWSFT